MRLRVSKIAAGMSVVALVFFSYAKAQFAEDALRFATPGVGVGARALAMGSAYTGVANDYSALYWNPAGLTQMQYSEFSLGLSHLNYKDKSLFFNKNTSYSNNSTGLNSLGLVFPVPARQGALVVAFGYNRQSEFTTGVSFSGFNPLSSIIQTWAADGRPYPPDITLAEDLKLAEADTNTGLFNSPIKNNVTQLGTVLESGGINNWSIGAGIDLAKNLSGGVTLTYLSGSYNYDRTYKEQDNNGYYTAFPFDFDELVIEDNVESELSGWNAKFGLMYRSPERFRFGLTVKTPSRIHVTESFNTRATSYFDSADVNGVYSYGPFDSPGSGEYDVVTPWVFSAGGSITLEQIILSADVDYTDWTQLRFDEANSDVIALNKDIKTLFRGTANWRVGAEYNVEDAGVRVRGGFMYNTSPYQGDPSTFDQKYITGGLGFLLSEATMMDLAYARGWWKTYRTNYDASSLVNEDVSTNNFILTFSYRF